MSHGSVSAGAPGHRPAARAGRLPGLHCRPRGRLDWATLLKRVFALEVLTCQACGGERRVVAEIKEGPIATKILAHLGLPTARSS